ncbi:MAG: squalene--hopene cyclase, partial [Anaerolineae bacterium]
MQTVTSSRPSVDAAIERAQAFFLRAQAQDGHWVGELEADSTITSEYLLLRHLLDQVDREREAKAIGYLRSHQLPDGGWNLFEGGSANLSATIKAYFALKLGRVPGEEPVMVSARRLIREMGGPAAASVFTKIQLALFGEYPWSAVPAMPAEIMLLPHWAYFNLYEVSYWSRTVIVPLLILLDTRPVKPLPPSLRLDELWPVPRERARLGFPRMPRPFSLRDWFWKNLFITADGATKIWERWSPRPFRRRALEAARLWLEPRLAVPGGLGGIYPAMAYSVLALRSLGYPPDHHLVRGQLKEIEALAVESLEALHYQPCVSPVWDTALAANALIESGLPANHPALIRAGEWLLGKQVLTAGDWQVKRRHAEPGGWPFQYHNDFYPDVDDTAKVLMALQKIQGLDPDRKRAALER